MRTKEKSNKGITLVALVLTIIILLILVGISIATLTNTGIFEKAKEAKEKSEEASKNEKYELATIEDSIHDVQEEKNIDKVNDENPGELEGSGNESDPYVINSMEDLVFFAYDVRNGNNYKDKNIELGYDLDFNSSKSYVDAFRTDYAKYGYDGELKTILTSNGDFWIQNEFAGNFDGKNHEIRNFYLNISNKENESTGGFFDKNKGEIRNLKIINSKILVIAKCYVVIGNIVGQNQGIIQNCYVSRKYHR